MQKQSADNMHQQGTKNAPSMFAVRHLGFVGQHQSETSRIHPVVWHSQQDSFLGFAATAVKMAVVR